jgi:HPt (histidine-containing phosphotransfer) domain-containing protein
LTATDPLLDEDVIGGLRALAHGNTVVGDLVDLLTADAEGALTRIPALFAAGDFAAAHREAHALAYASASVGAKRFGAALLDFARAAQLRDAGAARRLWQHVCAVWQETRPLLEVAKDNPP